MKITLYALYAQQHNIVNRYKFLNLLKMFFLTAWCDIV